jgi:uncharacterized surface protein with fasciclin (FAS1) repeats
MKNRIIPKALACSIIGMALCQCNKPADGTAGGNNATAESSTAGQSAVSDDVSQKDIVKVASGSPAHTTLVTAVKAAGLVDVLSNTGPFTVFAPVNEAFDKLPKGTVESLLKPENKDKLADILQYHVAVAVYKDDMLTDGRVINMANGGNIKISRKDGKIVINDSATIVGSVPASNGLIHVIDGVLLQPETK